MEKLHPAQVLILKELILYELIIFFSTLSILSLISCRLKTDNQMYNVLNIIILLYWFPNFNQLAQKYLVIVLVWRSLARVILWFSVKYSHHGKWILIFYKDVIIFSQLILTSSHLTTLMHTHPIISFLQHIDFLLSSMIWINWLF